MSSLRAAILSLSSLKDNDSESKLSNDHLRNGLSLIQFLGLMMCLCFMAATAGCASSYRSGECFEMRGSGSLGRVTTVGSDHYFIELGSDRLKTQWRVPKNQLYQDVRPKECPALDRFSKSHD